MAQTTTNYGFPYPEATDPASISTNIRNLALSVDSELYDVDTKVTTNYVYITASHTAAANEFIIANATAEITVTLPASPITDTRITIYNRGPLNVLLSSSSTIDGSSTIATGTGYTLIYKNSQWWCLPLSSSQPQTGWTRPEYWLEAPVLVNGEQVVYGIGIIYPELQNPFSLSCSNDYSVDWGDGTTTTHVADEIARHSYVFNDIPSSTITTEGTKQVLIEVRPTAPANLVSFASKSPYYEILITGPSFASFNTLSVSGIDNTRSLIIKHSNDIISGVDSLFNNIGSPIENVDINIPNASMISNLFADAIMIKKVVINSSPSLINMDSLFQYGGVADLTISDTSGVNIFGDMFNWWPGTEDSIPFLDTSSGTDFSGMFANSPNIKSVPNFNTSNALDVSSMFSDCISIREIPAFNLSNVTQASNFCSGASSLVKSNVTGLTVSHTYQNCSLSAAELNNIYTNLGTAAVDAVINVTGNPGVDTHNPSIAEAKGWTVIY